MSIRAMSTSQVADDEEALRPCLFIEYARRRDGQRRPSDAAAIVEHAAGAIVEAELEIGLLWRDSLKAGDGALSEQLVQVSHALLAAVRLLEAEVIGAEGPPNAILTCSQLSHPSGAMGQHSPFASSPRTDQ